MYHAHLYYGTTYVPHIHPRPPRLGPPSRPQLRLLTAVVTLWLDASASVCALLQQLTPQGDFAAQSTLARHRGSLALATLAMQVPHHACHAVLCDDALCLPIHFGSRATACRLGSHALTYTRTSQHAVHTIGRERYLVCVFTS